MVEIRSEQRDIEEGVSGLPAAKSGQIRIKASRLCKAPATLNQ